MMAHRVVQRAMNDFGRTLRSSVGVERAGRDAPLAPLTTFRVGGPADWLVETT